MATPTLQLTAPRVTPRPAPLVQLIERASAAAILLVVSPILLITLAAVRLLSGRSPFIAHRRVGVHNEEFWMLKIRTMWDKRAPQQGWTEYVDDAPVPPAKNAPDPRVTSPFARFCRRYSIDELPQFVHVVSGRMSIIGPRPMTRRELDVYYGSQASAVILTARPGITGLWQVMGRNRLTYPQRRRLDLFLVRHASLALNLRILALTPLRVLTGRNAW